VTSQPGDKPIHRDPGTAPEFSIAKTVASGSILPNVVAA